MKVTVAYITDPNKDGQETKVFNHKIKSHQLELLYLLHDIANGMADGKQVTFQTVEA